MYYIGCSGTSTIASRYNNIPSIPKLITDITTKPNLIIVGSML